jgi:dTDP-4-dehydrorhamnose reductase
MKILFCGANGQLGHEIKRAAFKREFSAEGLTRQELDITQPDSIKAAILRSNPTIIINCAAYTAVDKAESEPELAFAVNQEGPAHLAKVCSDHDIALIHISTDYVYDGTKNSAYLESDSVAPINVYGKSKAAGESKIVIGLKKHIIIRTSWLYGCHGNNFVKTMLRLGCERDQIGVVDDQFGCPTHAADLAEVALTVANDISRGNFSRWGIYHFASRGIVSWYEFAKSIFEIAGKSIDLKLTELTPLTTDQYPTAAVRPAYSVLGVKKIRQEFGIDPPFYLNSLKEMLSRLLDRVHP